MIKMLEIGEPERIIEVEPIPEQAPAPVEPAKPAEQPVEQPA